jgi:hypothetical protein
MVSFQVLELPLRDAQCRRVTLLRGLFLRHPWPEVVGATTSLAVTLRLIPLFVTETSQ